MPSIIVLVYISLAEIVLIENWTSRVDMTSQLATVKFTVGDELNPRIRGGIAYWNRED